MHYNIHYGLSDFKQCSYQDTAGISDGFSLPINVYLPTVKNKNNSLAVVCIHGGAWTSNLKKDEQWDGSWMKHNAYLLSTLGFIGLEITHRSINDTDIDGVIHDVTMSFRYINTVLKERHGISSVTVLGDSAGGHLALLSAFFSDKAMRPEKVISCNPVSDLTDPKWKLGITTELQRRCASPVFFSEATDTDIVILHGLLDTTVLCSCSIKLNEHLLSIGCKSKLISLPSDKHAFILYGYTTPIEQVNAHMQTVLELI